MFRLFIFLFLLIFGYMVHYIINLLIRQRLTETFISSANADPMFMLDESYKISNMQLHDRDDHFFLMTAILPGKVDIEKLKETNHNHTNYYYVDNEGLNTEKTNPNVVKHQPSKLSYPRIANQLTCVGNNHPIRSIIEKYQPYIYDQANLINYYDQPLYRDWRYPERPIDIRFAANPEKYCEQFPHVYPCFKYYSKW